MRIKSRIMKISGLSLRNNGAAVYSDMAVCKMDLTARSSILNMFKMPFNIHREMLSRQPGVWSLGYIYVFGNLW